MPLPSATVHAAEDCLEGQADCSRGPFNPLRADQPRVHVEGVTDGPAPLVHHIALDTQIFIQQPNPFFDERDTVDGLSVGEHRFEPPFGGRVRCSLMAFGSTRRAE